MPHGWRDVARQLLLFGGAYCLYSLVRGLVGGNSTAAFKHARELISIERTLHIFVEPSVQAWASGSHLVMVLATWLYLNAQTTVLLAALIYLYLCHNGSFYFVRNMLIVAMAIALAGYVVFPTAPPRFLPEWGFFDPVADVAGISPHSSASSLFNAYAAAPSMHVAASLMIGWPLARLARWRFSRVLWFLYPFVITFAVVATANHFVADAILGAVTAAAAAWAAGRMARLGPHAWRFASAPVAA